MAHVKERCSHADRHQTGIHEQREQQACVFSNDELPAADRLREQAVERTLLHFFVNQADSDEDRHHQPERGNRRKSQIYDDEAVNPDGNLSHQNRSADHHERKENEVVENAISNRFAERIDSDYSWHGAHRASTSIAWEAAFSRFTIRRKYSSSDGRTGCTERMRASHPRNFSSV